MFGFKHVFFSPVYSFSKQLLITCFGSSSSSLKGTVMSFHQKKKKNEKKLQFITDKTLNQHCHFMKKMNINHHILKILMVLILYPSKI